MFVNKIFWLTYSRKERGGLQRNLVNLRREVSSNAAHAGTPTAWVLQTPQNVRDEALKDFQEAYNTNWAKWKKNPAHTFTIGFRSKRKMQQESIALLAKYVTLDQDADPRDVGQLGFFPTFFPGRLRSAEPIPVDAQHYKSRLIRDKLGHYFLAIPRPLQPQPVPTTLRDPGGMQDNVFLLIPMSFFFFCSSLQVYQSASSPSTQGCAPS